MSLFWFVKDVGPWELLPSPAFSSSGLSPGLPMANLMPPYSDMVVYLARRRERPSVESVESNIDDFWVSRNNLHF